MASNKAAAGRPKQRRGKGTTACKITKLKGNDTTTITTMVYRDWVADTSAITVLLPPLSEGIKVASAEKRLTSHGFAIIRTITEDDQKFMEIATGIKNDEPTEQGAIVCVKQWLNDTESSRPSEILTRRQHLMSPPLCI